MKRRSDNCLCGRTLVEGRCASCALAPDVCDCEPVEDAVPVEALASGGETTGAPSPSPKRRGKAHAPPTSQGLATDEVVMTANLPKPTSVRFDPETMNILIREAGKRMISVSSLLRMAVRKVDWSKI